MTIEQTVEIPASRRLTIDVPRDIPAGPIILTFTPKQAEAERERTEEKPIIGWRSLVGRHAEAGAVESFLERHCAEAERERAEERERYPWAFKDKP